MSSWSSTFGFSAGVEGMFNVELEQTYKTTVEAQQKSESRRTVTRKVATNWLAFTDIVNMQLHQEVLPRDQGPRSKTRPRAAVTA